MEILETTQLIPGMTVAPLNTGHVLLSVHYSADPEGWTEERIAEARRRLGGQNSWKCRKEMEMDPNAQSGESVFDREWLDVQEQKHVRPSIKRLEVRGDGSVYEKSDGRIHIWILPEQLPMNLPHGVERATMCFGVGMDVGAGTGQSDSTIEGFAVQGMEQAYEFKSNAVDPTYLGRYSAAIGRYYNDPLVCCVQKMHGLTAIRAMRDAGYANLWRNASLDKFMDSSKGGRIGWVHGENSQALLMDNVGDALQGGGNVDVMSARGVIIHSANLLEQLRQYVWDENGRPVLAKNKIMNAMARKAHGDLVIGTALAIRACMDSPPYRDMRYAAAIPKSPDWYRQLYLDEKMKLSGGGDAAWQ